MTVNEAMQNLLTGRSIRKFKPDMIPDDILNRIIEAGTPDKRKNNFVIWAR